jgi:hypothetical protein
MDAVDGNAIGGLLIDVFSTEMAGASSTCGATRPEAELVARHRGPLPGPPAASSWCSSRPMA